MSDPKTEQNKRTLKDQFKQEEEIEDVDTTPQTEEKQSRALFVMQEFKDMEEERNKGYKWFGLNDTGATKRTGEFLSLIDYIDESERRLNGYTEKPAWKDEWQNNIFDPVTREKTVNLLAKLAAQRMKAKFLSITGTSNVIATVCTNLYEYAAKGKNGMNKDEVILYRSMYEAISKGTVVREETYKDGKRDIKKTKDGEVLLKSGKPIMKTIYEWEDVWTELVPLEDFYPGDISKQNVQEMDKCIVTQYPKFSTFKQKFSDYEDIDKVQNIGNLSKEDRIKYTIGDDVDDSCVQIIKYYNKTSDSFDITANGILITSLFNALPEHKRLPFTVARFDQYSNNFFYGMSLPYKLSTMQDITNSIWNLTLDELILSLQKPLFNASGSDIDIDWLYPRSIVKMPKGADINSVRELQMNTNTNSATGMLSIIKQRMDATSASGPEASGAAGTGRQRTAEEVSTAREAAMEIAGLFLQFMEWAEEDRAELIMQIILEKYSKKLKETGKYRRFVIEDVRLLSGELGKMIVNVNDKPREKELLNTNNKETDELSQVVDITPDMIRNFKYAVKIIPNSSVKDSEFQRINKELKWYEITREDPLFNPEEGAKELAEAFGKDVSKVLNREGGQEPQVGGELIKQAMGGGGKAGGGLKPEPLSNSGAQSVRQTEPL